MKKRALDIQRRVPPMVQALLQSVLLMLFCMLMLVNLVEPAAGAKRVISKDPVMIAVLITLLLLIFSLAILLTSKYRQALNAKNSEANLGNMAQNCVKSWIIAAFYVAAGIILISA